MTDVPGAEYLGLGLDSRNYTFGSIPRQGRVVNVIGGVREPNAPDQKCVRLDKLPLGALKYEETYGETYSEFTKELKTKVGLQGAYCGFEASMTAGFDRTTSGTDELQFIRFRTLCSSNLLKIPEDRRVLRRALTDSCSEALHHDDPRAVFDAYGTHVVVKVASGGSADYTCREKQSESMDRDAFKTAAAAAYKSVAGEVAASVEHGQAREDNTHSLEKSTGLEVCGGDPTLAGSLLKDPSDIAKWLGSVPDNPVFAGFVEDSLVPIWELVGDDDRQEDLEKAFKSQTKALKKKEEDDYRLIEDGADFEAGQYRIKHAADNERFLDAHDDGDFRVVTRGKQENSSQEWKIEAVPGKQDCYTIRHVLNRRFLDAYGSGHDHAVVTRREQKDSSQVWKIIASDEGLHTIQQESTGRYLDAHTKGSHNCVTRGGQGDPSQLWDFEPSEVWKAGTVRR